MSIQRFVITVKIGVVLQYYSEDAASGFMVFDMHEAKIFDTLEYAEDMAELLPKLYIHITNMYSSK